MVKIQGYDYMNMKFIDFYANKIWPIHKNFVSTTTRCNTCIISNNYTPINTNYICSTCENNKKTLSRKPTNNEPWDFISEYNDYGGALFLLSGGKDSLYTLLRFRKEFPDMWITCLTVNTGFIQPEVFDRCTHICNKLGLNYGIINNYIPEFYKTYQKSFLNLKKQTANECVDFNEGSLIFKIGEEIATNAGLSLVISGMSVEQCEDIVGTKQYLQKNENGLDYLYPMMYWNDITDEKIYEYLKSSGIIDNLSPVVSNNMLIPAMSAIDVLNHGYCGFEIEISKRIRSGRTKIKPWLYRFEMLEWMAKNGWMNKLIDDTLYKLKLTRTDVLKKST